MARMKFLCDAERCIECNGCVTACKNENEVPWGVNRRRVVTINDGVIGAEKSISVACMHCSDAPCMAVCPVDCFYRTDDGVVLHDKDLCIGCGYCFYACPFGAPQFPQAGAFGLRGKMDKCTFCAGGPEADRSRGRVQEVRPQPPGRGQAAGLRRDVLDQGAARRRRRRDRRHLPRARAAPRQGLGSLGLGHGLRPGQAGRATARGSEVMRRATLLGPRSSRPLFLAGCGESEQVVVYKQGKYQGKPDTRAWDNAPLAAEQRGGNWTKGDRASWEDADQEPPARAARTQAHLPVAQARNRPGG